MELNAEQVGSAVDELARWFPEEATTIAAHRAEIIDCIANLHDPQPGSPLLSAQYSPAPDQLGGASQTEAIDLDPCALACGIVVVDVILFCFGLVGLRVSNQERLTRALLQELGEDTLRGLARAIHNFSVADGAFAKATALFSLMGGIWNAGGFKAALAVIKDEMSWWDWVKTGTIAALQIAAWFATDGLAFIAEAALSIMSAEQLIEDAIKAGSACG